MNWTELIGYAAAILTTGSFLPQAWLTFRTRDVSGISLGMYSVFTLGMSLWLGYGLADRLGQCDHAGLGRLHPLGETALPLSASACQVVRSAYRDWALP